MFVELADLTSMFVGNQSVVGGPFPQGGGRMTMLHAIGKAHEYSKAPPQSQGELCIFALLFVELGVFAAGVEAGAGLGRGTTHLAMAADGGLGKEPLEPHEERQ